MNDPTDWQKSSYSGGEGADCVEVAHGFDGVAVREGDVPGVAILAVPERVVALIRVCKRGAVSL